MKTSQKQNEIRKELKKEEKDKQRLKKFDHVIEPAKAEFSFFTDKKTNFYLRLKKISYAVKGSIADVQKSIKSLRSFIERNLNKVLSLLFIYIICFGAIISTPIFINQHGVKSHNQTEQERFVSSDKKAKKQEFYKINRFNN